MSVREGFRHHCLRLCGQTMSAGCTEHPYQSAAELSEPKKEAPHQNKLLYVHVSADVSYRGLIKSLLISNLSSG